MFECTWRVLRSDGSEVGRYSDLVASMSAINRCIRVSVPVSGTAVSADANCGERLDTGDPYGYVFTDVAVSPSLRGEQSAGDFTFDARWLGPGKAGPVSCVYEVLDPQGTVIDRSQPVMFYVAAGVVSDHVYTLASERFATLTPASVDIDCRPFRGAT